MRRLNPWNPVDHFRLLGWVFLQPGLIAAYKDTYGDQSLRMVGSWLVGTLIWIPFMIPLLGYGLGSVPVGSSRSGLYLVGFFAVLWLLTGLLGNRTSEPVGFAAGITVFFMMMGLSFAVTAGATPGKIVSVMLVVSGVIVRGIAVVGAGYLAAHICGGVVLGIAAGTAAVIFGGVLAGFIIAVAVPAGLIMAYILSVMVTLYLRQTFERGRSTIPGKILLALVFLSTLVSLWVFFLGGWETILKWR